LVFTDRTGSNRAALGVDSRGVGTFTVVDRPGAARTPEPDADSSDDSGDTAPAALPPPTLNPTKK
jgi:hypothetical protein